MGHYHGNGLVDDDVFDAMETDEMRRSAPAGERRCQLNADGRHHEQRFCSEEKNMT